MYKLNGIKKKCVVIVIGLCSWFNYIGSIGKIKISLLLFESHFVKFHMAYVISFKTFIDIATIQPNFTKKYLSANRKWLTIENYWVYSSFIYGLALLLIYVLSVVIFFKRVTLFWFRGFRFWGDKKIPGLSFFIHFCFVEYK